MSYLLPGYNIIVGGLGISIFLTVFIPGRLSTWTMTILSGLAIIIISVVFHKEEIFTGPSLSEHLFQLLLIFFAALIVNYIKDLYIDIQSEKTHMTSLFENATEGIILTDSKGTIVLVNPAAEKMFEYTSDELVGERIEVLIPREYRKQHIHYREEFHHAPQNRIMGHGRDLYGQKKSGKNFPVEVSLSQYQKNQESFAIAFVIDITGRKQIEQNLITQKKQLEKISADIRRLNTQLEAKVEERTLILKEALQKLEQSQQELSEALDKERELSEIKSRFVSMASHEFRTPLSTVLSSASLLSKYIRTEDQNKRDRHINKIKESVKQLNDILEDFLSLGKLDEGKVHATFSEFNLPDLIIETTEEMRGMVKNDQEIKYVHEGQSIANTDKKLLRNILINLVGNAVKFSPEGSVIEVKSQTGHDLAEISVTDHGIGISKDDQEHLFSSFFRGRNAMNIQGTGLGLHIVKRYLDLLGGSVHLQSELNKGTSITIRIPVNHHNTPA